MAPHRFSGEEFLVVPIQWEAQTDEQGVFPVAHGLVEFLKGWGGTIQGIAYHSLRLAASGSFNVGRVWDSCQRTRFAPSFWAACFGGNGVSGSPLACSSQASNVSWRPASQLRPPLPRGRRDRIRY